MHYFLIAEICRTLVSRKNKIRSLVRQQNSATFSLHLWVVPTLFFVFTNVPLVVEFTTWQRFINAHLTNYSILAIDILSILFIGWSTYSLATENLKTERLRSDMFKTIIHRIPTKIVVYNQEHRYLYLNPAFESNENIRESIVGKDDFEYLSLIGKDINLALERRKKFIDAIRTKNSVEWIDSSVSDNGNSYHTLKRYKPLFNPSGKLEMVLGVDHDVTALVEMQAKEKEFQANLRYAKNIQNAILPNLNQHWSLGEIYVYHKPKDVVSGDFYWRKFINNTHYFAVADCTGHGVSGALLTIICHQALNRCLEEFELERPASVLNKCRSLILSTLKNGGSSISDGMDIALCAIKENQLLFSGANRPLWLMRNNTIKEYNGDRYPIGRYTAIIEDFNDIEIGIEPGDQIFLFSDGITDQFGGAQDKKFSKKRLRATLLKTAQLPHSVQQEKLKESVVNWIGNTEQLDDICFLSINYKGHSRAKQVVSMVGDSTLERNEKGMGIAMH